jgi:dipeptidyl aminopeptidase/acylaminoacyl peptidase
VSVPTEDKPVPLLRPVKDRRDLAPVAVALGIVVFVVAGVVKPWTAVVTPSAAPSAAAVVAPSPSPPTRAASPAPTEGVFVAGPLAGGPAGPVLGIRNGWVAFSKFDEGGIYLVREGVPARRITEADDGSLVQACPAFSADGRRLAYGQASGTYDGGYHDASLAVADVTPDGRVTGSISIPLHGMSAPPCGTWSPDGRWIAFGVQSGAREETPAATPSLRSLAAGDWIADEVWLVDPDTSAIRRLTGLAATDLEWSPDGKELAIANDVLSLYSVAADKIEPVGNATGVQRLSWSPDGRRLAYERTVEGPRYGVQTCSPGGFCASIAPELWIMNADGTDPAAVATGYDVMHGIGPVWSPDGRRIAFQRVCAGCREGHEVVLLSVGAAPVVLPPPRTEGPAGPTEWFPYSVTWSPDGTQLLYHAWGDGVDSGLVAVPVEGGGPPVVLYGSPGSVAVYSGIPWVPFQAWGRQADY